MIKFIIIIFIAAHLICVRADCNFKDVVRDFKGLKLVPIPNGYVIPSKQNNTIIKNGGHSVLYCVGGFEWYNGRNERIGKWLTIYCDGTQMLYTTEHNSNKQRLETGYNYYIQCKSFSANFYAGKIDHCDYEGLRQGITVKDVPMVSLEFCHDFNNSEPIFAHYIAAQRSIVLARQVDYNPSNVTLIDFRPEALVTIEDEEPPIIVLENDDTLFIPGLKQLLSAIDYKYSELTPNTLYQALNIKAFNYNFKTLNSVPWWTPLRVGNWAVFQKILSRQVEKESYSIYAGKSHRASFPNGFVCNSARDMTYDFDGRKKYIPLYIWNYIIPRRQDKENEEFVLIGINSPFVETKINSSLVICEDICDRISWLKPLEVTRKISSFGYMFCCKPEEVNSVLDGFPR